MKSVYRSSLWITTTCTTFAFYCYTILKKLVLADCCLLREAELQMLKKMKMKMKIKMKIWACDHKLID